MGAAKMLQYALDMYKAQLEVMKADPAIAQSLRLSKALICTTEGRNASGRQTLRLADALLFDSYLRRLNILRQDCVDMAGNISRLAKGRDMEFDGAVGTHTLDCYKTNQDDPRCYHLRCHVRVGEKMQMEIQALIKTLKSCIKETAATEVDAQPPLVHVGRIGSRCRDQSLDKEQG